MTERNLRKFTRRKAPFDHSRAMGIAYFAWWQFTGPISISVDDELPPKLFALLKRPATGYSKEYNCVPDAFLDLIQALRTVDALP